MLVFGDCNFIPFEINKFDFNDVQSLSQRTLPKPGSVYSTLSFGRNLRFPRAARDWHDRVPRPAASPRERPRPRRPGRRPGVPEGPWPSLAWQ